MSVIRNWHLTVLCSTIAIQASAVPVGFALSDDVAGPSCAYYLGMGAFEWSKKGGDWVDDAGVPYGPKAFDSQTVVVGGGRPFVEWDVTKLVQGWLDGRYPNSGFLLRAQRDAQGGVIDFHSRESVDRSAQPLLKLQWSDGSQVRIKPAADTFLDCSTFGSLGGSNVLKVSGNQSALLRFELPKTTAKLKAASLYLTSDVQYGRSARIDVFRAAPPFARAPNSPTLGLAQRFPKDLDIAKHPDVIFATGFESMLWSTEWSEKAFRSNAETVSEDSKARFEPLVGNALRVRLVKGSNFGLDLRYNFASKGVKEPEEIYFRYYLRFGADWNPFLNGGKMPGIAGTYGRAGWGMRRSDGYNGWSLRGSFAQRPAGARSVIGYTALGSYAYHADIQESSGEGWGWNEGPAGVLENGRWYAIEQYVKLNSPGKKNGIARAWVDGLQVMEKTNIRYRNTPDLKIESIWMDIYHGGLEVAPENMTLYIDNIVIARSYIGPMR